MRAIHVVKGQGVQGDWVDATCKRGGDRLYGKEGIWCLDRVVHGEGLFVSRSLRFLSPSWSQKPPQSPVRVKGR